MNNTLAIAAAGAVVSMAGVVTESPGGVVSSEAPGTTQKVSFFRRRGIP
jgi:formylmethanofuran:tetrahydromethanopterin formyltransferase